MTILDYGDRLLLDIDDNADKSKGAMSRIFDETPDKKILALGAAEIGFNYGKEAVLTALYDVLDEARQSGDGGNIIHEILQALDERKWTSIGSGFNGSKLNEAMRKEALIK